MIHCLYYNTLNEVVLFCLLGWDLQDRASFSHVLSTIRKSSIKKGVWTLFHGIWTYGVKIIEFSTFYEIKIRKLLLLLLLFDYGNGIGHTDMDEINEIPCHS